jgi:hypothetical protein
VIAIIKACKMGNVVIWPGRIQEQAWYKTSELKIATDRPSPALVTNYYVSCVYISIVENVAAYLSLT